MMSLHPPSLLSGPITGALEFRCLKQDYADANPGPWHQAAPSACTRILSYKMKMSVLIVLNQ